MKIEYYPFVRQLPFSSVHPLIADQTAAYFWESHLPKCDYFLPAGEACKTREEKEKLENALFALGVERQGMLYAVGGGAACDVVGFTAATFLRGIECSLVPTTLLAMVDASIGGKTAINVPQGKNLLGAFHLPKSVWICPEFLSTLSERELFCGYAEMVKIALLYDVKEAHTLLQMKDLKKEITLERIQKAIECKLDVIKRDPKEEGERELLNFGHTVGHALERASNYSLPHGEAVWLGMIVEIALSHLMGKMSLQSVTRLLPLLQEKGQHIKCLSVPFNTLFSYMRKDKKNRGKEVYAVLLTDPGAPLAEKGWTHPVSELLLEKAMENITFY